MLEDETAALFVLGNGSMGKPLLKDKKSSSKPFFHKYSQHFQKPSDSCCIAGLCINMFANAFMSLVYAFYCIMLVLVLLCSSLKELTY